MSIKAQIEAIIYAAEEPVTFPQIFELVKDDVREELARRQRELEAAADAPTADEAEPATATTSTATTVAPESPESVSEAAPTEDDRPSEATEVTAEPPESPESEQPLVSAPDVADTVLPSSADEQNQSLPAEATEQKTEQPAPIALSAAQPQAITDADVKSAVRAAIEELIADYNSRDRGIEVRQIAGGYRMATKPEQHDVVRAFAKSLKPPIRLSLQALETLAVVAYKQPITSPEISEVRGVDCGGVLGTLLDRKLITTAGRKQVIGRPILYKTTKEFLLRFGLKDVNELPSMEEFEKLAADSLGAELFASAHQPTPEQATALTAATEAPLPATAERLSEDRPVPAAEPTPEHVAAQTAATEAPLDVAPPSSDDTAEEPEVTAEGIPTSLAPEVSEVAQQADTPPSSDEARDMGKAGDETTEPKPAAES